MSLHLGAARARVGALEGAGSNPVLKAVIVVLLIAVIVSLFTGLGFLFKDSHRQDSKRTLYALGVRVSLAAVLMMVVFYGLWTGELVLHAPWHGH
jgi:succinate dehydrogenase hydrophobic anchor subunit